MKWILLFQLFRAACGWYVFAEPLVEESPVVDAKTAPAAACCKEKCGGPKCCQGACPAPRDPVLLTAPGCPAPGCPAPGCATQACPPQVRVGGVNYIGQVYPAPAAMPTPVPVAMPVPLAVYPVTSAMPEPTPIRIPAAPISESAPFPQATAPGAICQQFVPVARSTRTYPMRIKVQGNVLGCSEGVHLPATAVTENVLTPVDCRKLWAHGRTGAGHLLVRVEPTTHKDQVRVFVNLRASVQLPGLKGSNAENAVASTLAKIGEPTCIHLPCPAPTPDPRGLLIQVGEPVERVGVDFEARPAVALPTQASCVVPPPAIALIRGDSRPYQVQPALPAPAIQSVVHVQAVASARGTTVECVEKDGSSRLRMRTADGTSLTCVRTEMDAAGQPVTFSAGTTQVIVRGKGWKATASRVEVSPDRTRAMLSGSVKLSVDRCDGTESKKADVLCIDLNDGSVSVSGSRSR